MSMTAMMILLESLLLHHGKNLKAFCPCPDTVWKTTLKDNLLVDLMEAILRQQNLQAES